MPHSVSCSLKLKEDLKSNKSFYQLAQGVIRYQPFCKLYEKYTKSKKNTKRNLFFSFFYILSSLMRIHVSAQLIEETPLANSLKIHNLIPSLNLSRRNTIRNALFFGHHRKDACQTPSPPYYKVGSRVFPLKSAFSCVSHVCAKVSGSKKVHCTNKKNKEVS